MQQTSEEAYTSSSIDGTDVHRAKLVNQDGWKWDKNQIEGLRFGLLFHAGAASLRLWLTYGKLHFFSTLHIQ